jgi:hypothetical protein
MPRVVSRLRSSLLLLAPCCLFFGGCGGDIAPPAAPAAQTAQLTFDLNWPTRSRAVVAPGSALSVVVSLESGDPATNGPVTLAPIDRSDETAAYTQTVVAATPVRTGDRFVRLTFTAQKGGQGAVVATATRSVRIAADGTGLGEIALVGKVARVSVTGDTALTVGQSATLAFTALDAAGAALALSPGSVAFSQATGTALIVTPAGAITAAAVGTSTVKATVDGVASEPLSIAITAPEDASVTIDPRQSVGVGETKALGVQATGGGSPLPGSPTLRLVSGGEKLAVSGGSATGKAAGVAVVTATVAGIESAPQSVLIGAVETRASGLAIVDSTTGTGDVPQSGLKATVNYTGTLLSGVKFDSSHDPGRSPFTFTLGTGAVIAGFDEAVAGMRVGGRRIVVIPPDLGYGAAGTANIPPDATLIFDIELIKVNP